MYGGWSALCTASRHDLADPKVVLCWVEWTETSFFGAGNSWLRLDSLLHSGLLTAVLFETNIIHVFIQILQ